MTNTTGNISEIEPISAHFGDMMGGQVPTQAVQDAMPNLLASFNAMPGAEFGNDMSFNNTSTLDA